MGRPWPTTRLSQHLPLPPAAAPSQLCCTFLTAQPRPPSWTNSQALAASLLLFRQNPTSSLITAASGALGLKRALPAAARKPRPGPGAYLATWVDLNLPVLLMYCPVHTFFALWTVSFTFLPLKAAAGCWAAFLVPYYVLSSLGDFPHTGGSRSPARRGGPPAPVHLPSGLPIPSAAWRVLCLLFTAKHLPCARGHGGGRSVQSLAGFNDPGPPLYAWRQTPLLPTRPPHNEKAVASGSGCCAGSAPTSSAPSRTGLAPSSSSTTAAPRTACATPWTPRLRHRCASRACGSAAAGAAARPLPPPRRQARSRSRCRTPAPRLQARGSRKRSSRGSGASRRRGAKGKSRSSPRVP
jgi:hypothetical protein